jgi:hypothetical protein
MRAIRLAALGTAALVFISLVACGGGGDGGGIGGSGGTMRISLTDAPACGYDEVNVTVERVRVHQSTTAADADAGWSELVLTPARRVNLLDLHNGVLMDLGEIQLPAGRYTQLRLVLADNDAAHPLANSVLPTGGVETPLDTPSAQQSGLKMNVGIDVPVGQVADVVLDFDACKSVVKRGNSGRYNLKPVISVFSQLLDAGLRIEGWVDPGLANSGTSVSAQVQGVPVKATFPDATGRFVLYPVPAGSYELVVTAPARATTVITGVPVVQVTPTVIGSTSLRIAPAASAMRQVTGSVSPETAGIRVAQILGGGPTIEVAAPGVDADTGLFAVNLPTGAPQRASYGPAPFVFVPDNPVAGRYTFEANHLGVIKTVPVDATVPVVPPVNFIFP